MRVELVAARAAWALAGGPVQKTLKTASKYAESGYLFTRIQVKLILIVYLPSYRIQSI